MEQYGLVHGVHVITVVISITLFLARGVGMLRGATWVRRRPMRIIPHLNDTFLLLSALLLVVITHQYPLQQSWLTAKLVALVLYILLGMVALRWGRGRVLRFAAWLGALVTFAYIVAVALQRSPVPWA